MTQGLTRRRVAFAAAGLAVALPFTRAYAQQSGLPLSNPGALAPFASDPLVWDQVVADMLFVQSWRIQRAPMGYESSGTFARDLAQFRISVFSGRQQLPARLAAQDKLVADERERFLSVYSDRRGRFNEFLAGIGVAPEGPAGGRILQSTFVFANFGLVMLAGDAFNNARTRSYFWPFC